ncbi:MAG: hypothetical protein NW224_22815 [Leptolyngbyaceae cyanobacterium bins.302]|nr:hypothetical protein [Leptolyngbyaceae cyanobacterium bins.302]
MNCELNTRTLMVRLLLMMAIAGSAIAALPQINLDHQTNSSTQNVARERLSIQLNAQ